MKSRTEILVPLAAIQAVPIAVIAWYRLHRYAWYRYSAIVRFVCKGNSKRSDIPAPIWEKVQEHYSITSKIKNWDSDLWIHKDFRRNCNWNNAQTIKDLLNGKTLNDFSIMFDEAIDCVKGLDI